MAGPRVVQRACRAAVLVTALVVCLQPSEGAAQRADLACKQEPGNRYYWLEPAFCDLPMNGPERANGVVIWNHGIFGTLQSWMAPAPPAFRLLQSRGWDVIMLKRHNAAETDNNLVYRTVQRILQEAAAFKKSGYRKVVVAGQSFGGLLTLETIDTSSTIDAAIALAPGVRTWGAGRLDPSVVDRMLQRVTVGRLALVFPKNDDVFGNVVRGESAAAILSKRTIPYLLVDETSDITGHGGGYSGRFALRYGLCLTEFLAAPSLPGGRFACPQVTDEWTIVRELLLPVAERPTFIRDASGLPAPVGSLMGLRWAMLGDTVVLVAPVASEPGKLRLMYRSTGIGGGIFDATVNGGVIQAVLTNKSTITLKPEGDGVIVWTAADGSRSLNAPLVRGPEVP
jgi:pimeloyl-ACP methyl ester carboxylesterase